MEIKCENCGTVYYLGDGMAEITTKEPFETGIEAISYEYKCNSCDTMMKVVYK